MHIILRPLALALLALMLLAGAACAGVPASAAPVSALTETQAAEMIDSALDALNSGDYAAWSRDWSDAMKAAIQEADFLAYRETVLSAYGPYLSLADLRLVDGRNPGIVRWVATGDFERGQIRFNFAFAEDGVLIEGVQPEAVEAGG